MGQDIFLTYVGPEGTARKFENRTTYIIVILVLVLNDIKKKEDVRS